MGVESQEKRVCGLKFPFYGKIVRDRTSEGCEYGSGWREGNEFIEFGAGQAVILVRYKI